MATRYWVGGSGGDWSDTLKWSATTGGAGGASVPGSADTAIINAASLSANSTITVDATTTVAVLTISAVDVMVTLASAGNLTVTGTCAISTNTTYTNGLTIDGDATFGALTLTSGTLSLGTSNIVVNGIVTVTGSTTRTLAFGTGSITVNLNVAGATTVWSGATVTGMTVTGTRSVNFSFTGSNFGVTISHGSSAGGSASNAISIASITSSIASHNVTAAGHFSDFNFSSFTRTLGNSTRTIYGSVTLSSSMTLSSGTAVTTLAPGGLTPTITTNGVTLNFPITFNSSGGKLTLNDALTMGSSRTFTLTSGTISLNGFTLTCGIFSSSGSGARSIDGNGLGGYIVLNPGTLAGSSTIWSCATITNMTFVNGSPEVTVVANASTGLIATLNHGATAGNTSSNRLLVTGFTTSSSQLVVTTTGHFGYLNLDDPSGALRYTSGTTTVYGALLIGATTIVNASTSVVTLSSTCTLTTNGVTLNFPVTVANATTGCRLIDACTLGNTRTFSLTSGTFDLNGFTLTTGIFFSSGSTARTLDFNGGNIVVNAAITGATTVWSAATITNFSYAGTWDVSYNVSGNFAATIIHGTVGGSETTAYPGLVNPTVEGSLTVSGHYIDVDLSGISNTINAPAFSAYRDVKFSSSSTLTDAGAVNELTFRGSTYAKTLTMNGNTLASNLRLNAQGGTLYLNDAFQSTKSLTITAGTFDANDFNFTAKGVYLFSVGDKGINMKSGLWTLTGSSSVVTGDIYTWTAWNLTTDAANPTLTFDKGTADILLLAFADNHTSNFYGGGQTYNKVSMGGNYTGTSVTFYNSNTFSTLESLKTVAATIKFNDGTTQTIGTWNVNGSSGNLITLTSVSTGTHTLSKSSGTVLASYLNISKSTATGGATWRAPTNYGNVDGGTNTGWDFSVYTPSTTTNTNFFAFFF